MHSTYRLTNFVTFIFRFISRSGAWYYSHRYIRSYLRSQEKTKTFATTTPHAVDTSSASFQLLGIAADNSAVTNATLESIVQTDDDGRSYVDMYWTDAHAREGVVYLYGKTFNKDDFVSCCAVVRKLA